MDHAAFFARWTATSPRDPLRKSHTIMLRAQDGDTVRIEIPEASARQLRDSLIAAVELS